MNSLCRTKFDVILYIHYECMYRVFQCTLTEHISMYKVITAHILAREYTS